MIEEIRTQIKHYSDLNDIHQYRLMLNATDLFIKTFSNGVENKEDLRLGIEIIKHLAGLSYLGSLREYEHNYDLDREIRNKKIKVFKLCIPESHADLRGLTELIMGMKENSVG